MKKAWVAGKESLKVYNKKMSRNPETLKLIEKGINKAIKEGEKYIWIDVNRDDKFAWNSSNQLHAVMPYLTSQGYFCKFIPYDGGYSRYKEGWLQVKWTTEKVGWWERESFFEKIYLDFKMCF